MSLGPVKSRLCGNPTGFSVALISVTTHSCGNTVLPLLLRKGTVLYSWSRSTLWAPIPIHSSIHSPVCHCDMPNSLRTAPAWLHLLTGVWVWSHSSGHQSHSSGHPCPGCRLQHHCQHIPDLHPTDVPLPRLHPGLDTISVQFRRSVVSDSLRPHGLQQPGFPVHHQLPELAQTHVYQIGDAIQPSHPL